MKRLFEIGSKITIRSDLKAGMRINFGVNEKMERLAGKESKILDIDGGVYRLEIDNKEFSWNISMFAEFQLILEKHKKWLNNDPEGERANLRYANLSDADLSDANLRYANLSDANLSDANLRYANLSDADLSDANLRYANLRYANLSDANLRYANLSDANLSDADLSGADLSGADLSGAKNVKYPITCPERGAFIGFKKAKNEDYDSVIVELLILEDAKRVSATTRKCRCSKAKVLSITSVSESKKYKKARSNHDNSFIYEVGEIVEVDNFDEDRWNECSTGIHFFITRQEAVDY
ncbi:MAG: pentapeptide repeat-containing protein [Coprobacillus sp.]|nr:pentapeptide repeat-containing protein [Coprobacillus sp.]